MIPPPPPMSPDMMEDDEALGSMLISWYMSGYHTGYYLVSVFDMIFTVLTKTIAYQDFCSLMHFQGLKQGRKEAAAKKFHHK